MRALRSARRFGAQLRGAWYEGLTDATLAAAHLGTRLGASRMSRLVTSGLFGALVGARPALAQPGGSSCESGATGSIVKLIQNLGVLLYVIGGILFLVSFAFAALMFMGLGFSKRDRAYGAYNWAKNSVWGLALLASAFFLRSIVVDFVENSNDVTAAGSTAQPANRLLTKC